MRVKSLSSLRFLFFISIFLSHYKWEGDFLFPMGGPMGVSFFFMLSGFSLSMGYGDKIQNLDIKVFLKRRLRKLYPMHLITLGFRVITFLLIPLMLGEEVIKKVLALFLNLFLLQAWVPDVDLIYSYNTIAWFLSPIVFFYFMFPTLYKIVDKVNLKCFIPFVVFLYAIVVSFVPKELNQEIIYVSPLFRMVDFILGIACCKITKTNILGKRIMFRRYDNIGSKFPYLAEAIVVIIILLTIGVHGFGDARWGIAALFWLPMAAIMLILSLPEAQVGGGDFIKAANSKIRGFQL